WALFNSAGKNAHLIFCNAALASFLGLAQLPLNGGYQAGISLLVQKIVCALFQQADSVICINSAGSDDEGNIQPQLMNYVQCCLGAETGEAKIAEYEIPGVIGQRLNHRLAAFHPGNRRIKTSAHQPVTGELGICGGVFNKEDV